MAYAVFLAQWVVVSLSGVMAPGPTTAATVAAGTRRPHAGAWIAIGHGLVELPLVLLVVLGAEMFKSNGFRIGIGLAGGAILLLMAWLTVAGLKGGQREQKPAANIGGPVWTGVVMTGGNPYFLLWWATVGLALATQAIGLGMVVFGLFIVVHWLCDLVWLEVLSRASHKGVALFGPRGHAVIGIVCAVAMGAFGAWFLYDATRLLLA